MIAISPKDLIEIFPDLINLFLSGFIFMSVYNWLNNKKTDISVLTIWSLFISFLVEAFYSMIHGFLFNNIVISDSIKIFVYSVTGLALAFICTQIKRSKLIQRLLYQSNNKSVNDDVFQDIIDYKKPTMLNVYLKSANVYYIGKFCSREELGLDSWIVLINYFSVDKETNNPVFDPDAENYKSTVAINLRDVERIEIIYEEDSETWKRLIGENNN